MVAVYSDVILPASVVASGIRGQQMRKNQRVSTQSGYMQANVQWSRTLRKFTLGVLPMTVPNWRAIEGLFEVTEGGAYGFLMQDPKDQDVAAGEGLLQGYTSATAALVGTAGTGYGVPSLRLLKRYTSVGSSRTKDRRISRPKAQAITRNGAAVNVGASAGDISIDSTTGTITFVPDVSQLAFSISAGAATTLNFLTGVGIVAGITVGERVYLSGFVGTAAAVLNGTSHQVTAKGATSLTIATNTTGLSATDSSGTAARYPQATDAMAWTGSFYVPVQFENDEIDWDMILGGADIDARLIAGPQVTLVEVME
jgi:uncharacterized protein (TIGR02217 family)